MSIIRAPRKESNYYVLDKQISEDKRLTWAARGLLVFLLGKPDHWSVNVQALINETKGSRKPTGRDGVYALLDELIQAGYVARRQLRNAAGVLGEISYIVSESPLPAQPYTAQPYPAPPYTANPTLVSNEEKQELKVEQELKGEARAQAPAAPPPRTKGLARRCVKPQAKVDDVQRPDGVAEQVWADWLALRKAKRAPVSLTVLEGAQREADKAGMSLDAFLREWVGRGSQGLKAEWLQEKPSSAARSGVETFRERDERLAREKMAAFLPDIAAKTPPGSALARGVIDITPTFPSIGA